MSAIRPEPPRSLEDILADKQRMLETLFDHVDGMVYLCRHDEQWTMEFVSVGCERLTGWRPIDLVGNRRVSYEQVTHPLDRGHVRDTLESALAARRKFELEYRIRRADGEVRWVWERGSGIYGADGGLIALQGLIQDVTVRHQMVQALQEAERRYRSIFEHAIEGIYQTTLDGRYLQVNPALARLYGYASPQDMIASLRDIGRQLYVDAGRRDEFVRLIRGRGVVSNFESQVRRRDGSVIWISENAREVRDAEGRPAYFEGTVEDITERKAAEGRLAHQATHDALTGLPNRMLLRDRLAQAIRHAERERAGVGVVFVDLDNFKAVNDSLGHAAGDVVIRTVATRLRQSMRDSDTVARLGGDEFVVLMPGVRSGSVLLALAVQRILQVVRAGIPVEGREVAVTCSVGAALAPDHGRDIDVLLASADRAMYSAKAAGRNAFRMVEEDDP